MTSYITRTLTDGERVLHTAKFHWLYTVTSFFYVIFFGFVGLVTSVVFSDAWLWFAALGPLVFLVSMIIKWTTEIAITNRRVVYKRGWIGRETDEINLNRIEETTLSQSVGGRIFGYGKLVFKGVGIGEVNLPAIDDPIHFRRQLKIAQAAAAATPSAAG